MAPIQMITSKNKQVQVQNEDGKPKRWWCVSGTRHFPLVDPYVSIIYEIIYHFYQLSTRFVNSWDLHNSFTNIQVIVDCPR